MHVGRIARVAMSVPGYGIVLIDRTKLTLQGGVIVGDLEEDEKRQLEKMCSLLWDNTYYSVLDPKRRK